MFLIAQRAELPFLRQPAGRGFLVFFGASAIVMEEGGFKFIPQSIIPISSRIVERGHYIQWRDRRPPHTRKGDDLYLS